MNEDSRKLLEECTSGCTMAVESMKQVGEYVQDDTLGELFEKYREEHERIWQEANDMLGEAGEEEKEPGRMASAFSWLTAEMKLMMRDDNHQIAKLMMNGCNMGIQSISEHLNDYVAASDEARRIAKQLIRIEEEFMKNLREFL
ncbi:MAG: hypothetical protein ACI4CT_04100 [Lachnospiraceae bacterium]